MRSILALFGALVLASATSAQLTATLTGKIERAPVGPCNVEATHRVACTEILLKSTAVNLTSLEGRMVLMEGAIDLSGGPTCPTLDVLTAVDAPNRTTTLSFGGYRRGTSVLFTTISPVGSVVLMMFAAGPGFLPLGTFGTYQLDLATSFYWSMDISVGLTLRNIAIPNDASLAGVVIQFQTAYGAVTPTLEFGFLNTSCFTIR